MPRCRFICNIIGVCCGIIFLPKEYIYLFIVIALFAADTHLGRACRNVFIPSLPDVDISKEFQDIKPLLDNDDKSRTKSKTYWEEIHKEHQTALRSDTDTQHDSSNVSTDNSTDPSFQKKQRPDAITLGSTISKYVNFMCMFSFYVYDLARMLSNTLFQFVLVILFLIVYSYGNTEVSVMYFFRYTF